MVRAVYRDYNDLTGPISNPKENRASPPTSTPLVPRLDVVTIDVRSFLVCDWTRCCGMADKQTLKGSLRSRLLRNSEVIGELESGRPFRRSYARRPRMAAGRMAQFL